MKHRLFLLLVIAALVLSNSAIAAPAKAQKMPVIGFMQLVTHPALDAGREGAVKALNDAGFVDGKTAKFLFANAENDIPTLATIAQKYLDQDVDLIIATSTPAAQAAYKATAELENPPIVYNVVTSPYAAGLAQSPCVHPAWVIGTQALAPYEATVPLIFKIKPEAKTVGYIYNPAEANSVASTKIIQPIMDKLKLTMVVQTIASSSELTSAAQALADKKVDVFYVATDSTVVAGLEALIKVANENKIPVIGSDPASAKRGAVIAQGLDYFQEGLDAGRIAAAILNKKLDISKAKINAQKSTQLALNLDSAEAQGVTIPDDLVASAALVYKGGQNVVKAAATMAATQPAGGDDPFMKALTCTQEDLNPAATQAK
jgi:putative ABC transport system substrate-binding protein